MQRYRSFIGGNHRETASVDVITSPYDGTPIAEVALGSAADLDLAISAADAAFAKTRTLPSHRRAALLDGTARSLREKSEMLARLIALESGKPIRYAKAEVTRAVSTFELGAAVARQEEGEVLPVDLSPATEGRLCVTRRVPRGPVGAIAPFNFPLNLVAHKLSPALAVGASVVLKPAHQSPLTAHALAEILHELGLLPGALNVVHAKPEVGERLARDERIKVLSFTGSDAVGWKLKGLASKKQVLLELGGNAPCIVDETADLERAIPGLVEASFANAGQICIKTQRLIVARQIFDDFVERFVAATRALKTGDPLDPETVVGPLIERRHVERVIAWVREAEAGGAKVLVGGEASGSIVEPTVLVGVEPEMRVYRDEIFGPVSVIEPFETWEQAMELANASRFGLQASVYTRDIGRALSALRALEFGGVLVNQPTTFRVDNYPYGGGKDSGFGREGVRYAAREYTEERVLVLGAG
jgi:acyl-CoA reductase-like NAD-dependent aldehyde dehydrogenase